MVGQADKAVCVEVMDVGMHKILDLIYSPGKIAKGRERAKVKYSSHKEARARREQAEMTGEETEATVSEIGSDGEGDSQGEGTSSSQTAKETVRKRPVLAEASSTKRKASEDVTPPAAKRGRPRKD